MSINYTLIVLANLYLLSPAIGQNSNIIKTANIYRERTEVIEDYNVKNEFNIELGEDEEFDPDDYIERPCPVYDRFCIRGFFAQHSNCRIVPGLVPDPFYLAQAPVYLVNSNLTTTVIDSYITGVTNGRIEEFYINRKTNKLVLSIYFPTLNTFSQTYFQFHRNGAEPVQRIAPADQLLEGLASTIVFPNFNDLKLDESEITGYLENGLSPFTVDLNVLNEPDPVVIAGIAAIASQLPLSLRELLLTAVKPSATAWIEYNICDFGVPVNRIGL